MTFLASGLATTDPDFRLRIQAGVFKLAQDVLNEPEDVEGYDQRRRLAIAAVQAPDRVAARFVWLCAANPSIAATVVVTDGDVTVGAPDGDIEFVCASNWSIVAGWGS